jgi:hypothetical protein
MSLKHTYTTIQRTGRESEMCVMSCQACSVTRQTFLEAMILRMRQQKTEDDKIENICQLCRPRARTIL